MDDNYGIFRTLWNGDISEFRKEIQNYDINCKNENSCNLLQIAITTKNDDIAIELLNRSINVNLQDKHGQTSLHYLGVHKNIKLARLILQKGGDVNIRDSYGNIPLWTAVFNARKVYDYVELLVQYKSNPLSINNAGRSSLDFANQIKDMALVSILTDSTYSK
jgi:uncharacterized protein